MQTVQTDHHVSHVFVCVHATLEGDIRREACVSFSAVSTVAHCLSPRLALSSAREAGSVKCETAQWVVGVAGVCRRAEKEAGEAAEVTCSILIHSSDTGVEEEERGGEKASRDGVLMRGEQLEEKNMEKVFEQPPTLVCVSPLSSLAAA